MAKVSINIESYPKEIRVSMTDLLPALLPGCRFSVIGTESVIWDDVLVFPTLVELQNGLVLLKNKEDLKTQIQEQKALKATQLKALLARKLDKWDNDQLRDAIILLIEIL